MRLTLLAGMTAVSFASFIPGTSWEAPNLVQSDAVESGHKLALYLCSTCHDVDPNQEFPPALINPAPSFASIANNANSTRASLRKFLNTTHGDVAKLPIQMPDVMLTESQKDAAVAYIMSLRNPP